MKWFLEAVKNNYANFSSRARRSEYWYFILFYLLIYIVLMIIDNVAGLQLGEAGIGILGLLFTLAMLVPSISVGVRRLHDTGRSGWWLLIGLVPLIGGLVLLWFYVQEGVRGSNQYGADPKAIAA